MSKKKYMYFSNKMRLSIYYSNSFILRAPRMTKEYFMMTLGIMSIAYTIHCGWPRIWKWYQHMLFICPWYWFVQRFQEFEKSICWGDSQLLSPHEKQSIYRCAHRFSRNVFHIHGSSIKKKHILACRTLLIMHSLW